MPNPSAPTSSTRLGRNAPVLVAVAVLVLAACGGGEETIVADPEVTATLPGPATTAPDATAPASPEETATTTDAPATPFPANTEQDTGEASGELIAVTDVTTSTHAGYDRVTFAIGGGDGQAGWEVSYVDDPTSQGSGDAVSVDGEATLRVVITNVGLPPDTGGETYSGPERISPDELPTVTEIVDDSIFEGRHVFFVGTTAETPFRVQRDPDTGAVVLEVQHTG